MKNINKLVLTSVILILICSLGYNIYLSHLNKMNSKYYEQILRVRIENDATFYYLLKSGKFELLQETIMNDFAFFSKEMEMKYNRKLSVSKDLDSLVKKIKNE
jgi:hypothetical protein